MIWDDIHSEPQETREEREKRERKEYEEKAAKKMKPEVLERLIEQRKKNLGF